MSNNFYEQSSKLVVIGASTGGPQALQEVLTNLPGSFKIPILIVQHMPQNFTEALAKRLDGLTKLRVKEAEHGEPIRAGTVYIAPGSRHLRVIEDRGFRSVALSDEEPVGNHKPAVNVLFKSVADMGRDLVAVILTGMGRDGLEGVSLIKNRGGYIIAQDEASCVVYGMPKAVIEAGLADEICALPTVAQAIVSAVGRKGV